MYSPLSLQPNWSIIRLPLDRTVRCPGHRLYAARSFPRINSSSSLEQPGSSGRNLSSSSLGESQSNVGGGDEPVTGQSKVRGRPASNARVKGVSVRDRVGGEQEREVSMESEGAAMI